MNESVWQKTGEGMMRCIKSGTGVRVASEDEARRINLIMGLVWAAMLQAETRQENTKCAELYGRISDAITNLVCPSVRIPSGESWHVEGGTFNPDGSLSGGKWRKL